jgi:hypothetical protein
MVSLGLPLPSLHTRSCYIKNPSSIPELFCTYMAMEAAGHDLATRATLAFMARAARGTGVTGAGAGAGAYAAGAGAGGAYAAGAGAGGAYATGAGAGGTYWAVAAAARATTPRNFMFAIKFTQVNGNRSDCESEEGKQNGNAFISPNSSPREGRTPDSRPSACFMRQTTRLTRRIVHADGSLGVAVWAALDCTKEQQRKSGISSDTDHVSPTLFNTLYGLRDRTELQY